MVARGGASLRGLNDIYWASPTLLSENTNTFKIIAKASEIRRTGLGFVNAGKVSSFLGYIGLGYSAATFFTQLANENYDGAIGTLGNTVGAAVGAKIGAWTFGEITVGLGISSTGAGALIMIVGTGGFALLGGKAGEELLKSLAEVMNEMEIPKLTQEQINQKVSIFLPKPIKIDE